MCGLPRCGKSTWIKKNKGEAIVVCPDEVRAKVFGHQFHLEAEGFVWAFVKSMVRLILEQNKDVIVDATHTTYGKRSAWVNMAKDLGVKLRIVWIKTSIEVCKRRSMKSKEGNIVPVEVIDRMAAYFEDPFYEYEEGVNIEVVEMPKSRISDETWKVTASLNVPMNYYQTEPVKILTKMEGIKNGKTS